MMMWWPNYRLQLNAKKKSWLSTNTNLLSTKVRHALSSSITHGDHSTVNKNKDDEEEIESQDENDMGHEAHVGGGFTSAVSLHLQINIELKYGADNIKGHCTAWLLGTSKKAIGP